MPFDLEIILIYIKLFETAKCKGDIPKNFKYILVDNFKDTTSSKINNQFVE